MGQSASSECTGEPTLTSGSESSMQADHELIERSIFKTNWTVHPVKVIIGRSFYARKPHMVVDWLSGG
jgi:hypothetical protein